ncbi:MAG: phosphatase PAP2 family protein [Oscillospiraceae bacterium]
MELLQNFDTQALLFIQDNLRLPFLDYVMVFLTRLGDGGFIWILAGLILLIPKKTRRGGFDLLICLMITAVLNNLLIKELVSRLRPYDTIAALSILVEPEASFSFPSGHASASLAAALALTLAFGKKGAFAYIPAVLIAISRCYVGVHYPTDIFAGMAVGTIVALLTYCLLHRFVKTDFIPKRRIE